MNPDAFDQVVGPQQLPALRAILAEVAPPVSAEDLLRKPELLRETRVVITGWGGPRFDQALLAHAPRLEAVFHMAGSIRPIVSDAFWDRDISISSAASANATPVAEYCLAQTLMLMKNFYAIQRIYHNAQAKPHQLRHGLSPGAYGRRVGLVSFGQIARQLRKMLRPHALEVAVYDPYLDEHQARENDVVLSSLEELFATSQVISVHTPSLPDTYRLIRGEHLQSLPQHAGFINTSRGAVVDETALIETLQERPDITAVLDVTDPEPPIRESPLWKMPNVVLTPHIAGSVGSECHRMCQLMVDELGRFSKKQPLRHQISRETAMHLA
ncbi:MAG: hydroxyacid dehydrogenase [Planctomycetota bacterium]